MDSAAFVDLFLRGEKTRREPQQTQQANSPNEGTSEASVTALRTSLTSSSEAPSGRRAAPRFGQARASARLARGRTREPLNPLWGPGLWATCPARLRLRWGRRRASPVAAAISDGLRYGTH